MALAHYDAPRDHDAFVHSVARNIRSLLAMRELEAQDLAEHVGMSSAVLSQRMSGRSAWRGFELSRIAQAFAVDTDVIFASTEAEFREALARSRCSSGFDLVDGLDVIGKTSEIPGQRKLALAH